jgi:hypothetical protein
MYGDKYKHENGYFNGEALEYVRQLKVERNLSDCEIASKMGCSIIGVRTLAIKVWITYVPLKNKKWTKEDRELAKVLRAEGKTAQEIGDRLGVSRNSVIGQWKRMGICDPKNSTKAVQEAGKRRRIIKALAKAGKVAAAPAIPAEPVSCEPELDIPVSERKPIITIDQDGHCWANEALTAECCWWPVRGGH